MGLIRFVVGLLGALLGGYTVYAAGVALRHGTNPSWVAFVGLVMLALSALLIKAALDRPPDRISAGHQIAAVLAAAASGGSRGYFVGRLPGLVIGATVGAFIGSLYLLVGAGRTSNESDMPAPPVR